MDFGKWLPWLRLSQDSGKPNVLGVIRKDLALPWPGGPPQGQKAVFASSASRIHQGGPPMNPAKEPTCVIGKELRCGRAPPVQFMLVPPCRGSVAGDDPALAGAQASIGSYCRSAFAPHMFVCWVRLGLRAAHTHTLGAARRRPV